MIKHLKIVSIFFSQCLTMLTTPKPVSLRRYSRRWRCIHSTRLKFACKVRDRPRRQSRSRIRISCADDATQPKRTHARLQHKIIGQSPVARSTEVPLTRCASSGAKRVCEASTRACRSMRSRARRRGVPSSISTSTSRLAW